MVVSGRAMLPNMRRTQQDWRAMSTLCNTFVSFSLNLKALLRMVAGAPWSA